jgi:septum site-determining protein MinC
MPVALAGRAPATFEIKSANLPLVALLLKSPDLQRLAEELDTRFGELPEFFDHDPMVIDLAPLQAGEAAGAELDFPALLTLLRRFRVMPVAAKGGSAAQMKAAIAAGLAAAPEAAAVVPAGKGSGSRVKPGMTGAGGGTTTPPAMPPAAPMELAPASALVIDKPLRSGQQVYARGRDLVVLSMVNPGAEVIADGHIHVYAPLRGKAMAGARGNADARILTLCLEPELVSIAGVYRTSEVPLPDEVLGRPAQIRLAGNAEAGRLEFQPLTL